MPKFRLTYERDALVRGVVEIEAASLAAAREVGVVSAGKHGVRLQEEVEWDTDGAILLDSAEFVGVDPIPADDECDAVR